ncbi:MAG: hypothetical protein AMXMBFR47_44850 [Planctomycetota bacterium]
MGSNPALGGNHSRDRSLAAFGFVLAIFGGIATLVGAFLLVLYSALGGYPSPFPRSPDEIAAEGRAVAAVWLKFGAIIAGGALAMVAGFFMMASKAKTHASFHAERAVDHLLTMVGLISLPADEVNKHFPDFVCINDELALELNHWLEVAAQYPEYAALPNEVRSKIEQIDRAFAEKSKPEFAKFWADESRYDDPDWLEIRDIARQVMRLMRRDPPVGDLSWMTFVRVDDKKTEPD